MKQRILIYVARRLGLTKCIKGLLGIDNTLRRLINILAIEKEPQMIHPKHRLTRYHDFFAQRLADKDIVLDVGCGNGALLADIIKCTGSRGIGIDIDSKNIDRAMQFCADTKGNLFFHGDIFDRLDHGGQEFKNVTAIIMSNVLEHLEQRATLITALRDSCPNARFLIRVPCENRDWLVAYKKELGVEWRSDSTHYLEYTVDTLHKELQQAGLAIQETVQQWGELYVQAK